MAKILGKGQWYNDGASKTLKLGDGLTDIDALENLWPLEFPPSDDNMYALMNGEYHKILPTEEDVNSMYNDMPPATGGYKITGADAVLGYIATSTGVKLVNYAGTEVTRDQDWFNSHKPWSRIQEVDLEGNAMISIPRYWYKIDAQPDGPNAGARRYMIASYPAEGFVSDAAAFKGTATAGRSPTSWRDQIYLGKYRSKEVVGKAMSVASGTPLVNKPYGSMLQRHQATLIGTVSCDLMSFASWWAVAHLAVMETQTDLIELGADYRGLTEFFGNTNTDGINMEMLSGLEIDTANQVYFNITANGSSYVAETGINCYAENALFVPYIFTIQPYSPVAQLVFSSSAPGSVAVKDFTTKYHLGAVAMMTVLSTPNISGRLMFI